MSTNFHFLSLSVSGRHFLWRTIIVKAKTLQALPLMALEMLLVTFDELSGVDI
jgi:hypothetical protein